MAASFPMGHALPTNQFLNVDMLAFLSFYFPMYLLYEHISLELNRQKKNTSLM
jgi:hypothetical protein